MMRLEIPCPAKINTFLAVGPRDAIGYHPLRTVFQAIDLFDTLTIETGVDADEFTCDDPTIPAVNTVTRAWRFAREIVPLPPLRVSLTKRIPSESGLGGGSSDAAGFLRAIPHLVKGNMPTAELAGIASAVGADVPFFLVGGCARGEGYGEKLTPLPDRETRWLVVVLPNARCATGLAYQRLDDTHYDWRTFPSEDCLYNDFERVAPCESVDTAERLQMLGADDAGITGSGAAVFGRFSNEAQARRAAARAEQESLGQVWVCRTLSRAESLVLNAAVLS